MTNKDKSRPVVTLQMEKSLFSRVDSMAKKKGISLNVAVGRIFKEAIKNHTNDDPAQYDFVGKSENEETTKVSFRTERPLVSRVDSISYNKGLSRNVVALAIIRAFLQNSTNDDPAQYDFVGEKEKEEEPEKAALPDSEKNPREQINLNLRQRSKVPAGQSLAIRKDPGLGQENKNSEGGEFSGMLVVGGVLAGIWILAKLFPSFKDSLLLARDNLLNIFNPPKENPPASSGPSDLGSWGQGG